MLAIPTDRPFALFQYIRERRTWSVSAMATAYVDSVDDLIASAPAGRQKCQLAHSSQPRRNQ